MRRWPFGNRRTEKRAGYTDAVISELQRRTQTLSADPERTAAAQSAGGLWGRCLAVASVTPASPITKRAHSVGVVLDRARSCACAGQALWWFTVDTGMAPRLWNVGEFDITGDYDPDDLDGTAPLSRDRQSAWCGR